MTHKGAFLAVPRAQAPPAWLTIAGKVLWMMKMWFTSSVRPRSWATQGKPPSVAPERQPRLERMGVLGPARADVAASVVERTALTTEATRRTRARFSQQPTMPDETCRIVISRRG